MAIVTHLSTQALQTYLQTFDASAEVHVPNDISEALALLEFPPSGKVHVPGCIDAGGNTILLVFTTSGLLAGVKTVSVQGNFFLVTTATSWARPVLGTPVTVLTHASPKALEDYLKTFDATATVGTYSDISQAAAGEAGAKFVVTSPGRITFVKGSALGALLFVMDKGVEYTTVKK